MSIFFKKHKKHIFFTLIIMLFIIFIFHGSEKEWQYDIKKIENGAKIVAFGDSLTYGYKLPDSDNYPIALQNLLGDNVTVVNYGVNGDTTEDGLRRIDDMLNDENPSLVLLGLGGNDFLKNVDKNKTIKNLEVMIDKIKNSGADVVLLPVPNPSFFRKLIATAAGIDDSPIYQEIAEKKEVPVINNIFSDLLVKNKYKIDLIHLNKEGYQLVAEEIVQQFKENGVLD